MDVYPSGGRGLYYYFYIYIIIIYIRSIETLRPVYTDYKGLSARPGGGSTALEPYEPLTGHVAGHFIGTL